MRLREAKLGATHEDRLRLRLSVEAEPAPAPAEGDATVRELRRRRLLALTDDDSA